MFNQKASSKEKDCQGQDHVEILLGGFAVT